ncbi:SpdD protein [Kitasatospora sp. NBC_00070]|uniref:SpdD protein n=1 Tax=Kitasatospora sp. NBC_00070 TaxID=2975962 RepID=UPI0032541B0A
MNADHSCTCGQDHGHAMYPVQRLAYPPVYPVYPQPPAPVPARPIGGYVAAGAGAVALLVPVLMTVTALLVALGLAAVAIAVCALVCRWIIRDIRKN